MNIRLMTFKRNEPEFKRPPNIEWKMKDKTIVLSYDMADSHIVNCINLLINKRRFRPKDKEYDLYIDAFNDELKWRRLNDVIINKTIIRDLKFE